MKLEQLKQKKKKKRKKKRKGKKFRKQTVEKKIEIARIVEEKEEKQKDLIEIRTVEKMISKIFYKYLKIFKKKDSERMLMRKPVTFCVLASSVPIHK